MCDEISGDQQLAELEGNGQWLLIGVMKDSKQWWWGWLHNPVEDEKPSQCTL